MKLTLRIALSLLLIALLFTYAVDAREVLRLMQRIAPLYLLLAFAIVTLDRVLMTFKWILLLKAQGHQLPLLRGVAIYCSSMVWGLALPATVGADAVRAVMLTRRGFNGTDVLTTIVLERVLGFVLALALGLVSLIVLRSLGVLDARFDQALYLGVPMLLAALAVLAASMSPRLVASLSGRFAQRLRRLKFMDYLERFTRAYHALGAARSTLAWFCVLTLVEQLFCVPFSWAIARGLGIAVDPLLLLGVMPLSMLISRLPISFDGIGVFEAVFVGVLMLAGISAEAALAMAISGRIVNILAFLPWWLSHVALSGAVRPPASASKELGIH